MHREVAALAPIAVTGRTITLPVKPFQVVTLRLRPVRSRK